MSTVNGQPERQPGGEWAAAAPEIGIAVIVVACAAVTGYAAAGLPGIAVVITVAAAAALAVLRFIVPAQAAPPGPGDDSASGIDTEAIPGTFTGFWRRRAGLSDATESLAAYDGGLRVTLQHLLAARLAERHGVILQNDPATARQLLCPRPRDDGLWYWVDPARPPAPAGNQRGIPPRTLAQLIDRLERL